jgi:hypothetical protein
MNHAKQVQYYETLEAIGKAVEAILDEVAASPEPNSPTSLLVGAVAMLCSCVTVGCERIATAIEESAP